jgi:PAS domain S-box-containing protein
MQNDELRHAQEDLELSRDAYAELYDFAPVGYFTIDTNIIIRRVNLAGAAMLNIAKKQLVNRPFVSFIAEAKDRELFTDHIKLVRVRKVMLKCSLSLKKLDGETIHCLLQSVAISNKDTNDLIFISIIDDTVRYQLEKKLAVLHSNLETSVVALKQNQHELEILNDTLEVRITQAVEELRQKDMVIILQERHALMGEMIKNIAHQWRQPLNTLALIIQKLNLFYGSDKFNKEFLGKSTDKAMMYIKQMSTTIDDFMNFFRVDKLKVAFNIDQVLGDTVRLIKECYKEDHISIDMHCEGGQSAEGFPNEFAQVLLNVFANARDVLLERKVNDALICVRTFGEAGKAIVTITDNGGGIDNAIIDKLFDVYFTTRGPDRGTGIGLYMSKTIIETNMGGILTVRNIGNGAEFRIEV